MRGILLIATTVVLALPFLGAGRRASRSTRAGTAQRMELEELVAHADLVLEARVVSTRAVESDDGRVYTDCQLLVDRTFLGEEAGVRTVRLPGGVLASGRGMLVPGMPQLRTGQELFLCLSEPSANGARVVVGLTQGSFRIVRDPAGGRYVVRDDATAALVDERGAPAAQKSHLVVEYAEMLARLEAAANAARARRTEGGR